MICAFFHTNATLLLTAKPFSNNKLKKITKEERRKKNNQKEAGREGYLRRRAKDKKKRKEKKKRGLGEGAFVRLCVCVFRLSQGKKRA